MTTTCLLMDAAIWNAHPRFDDLVRTPQANALYGDLPSPEAARLGPWLLDAEAAEAILADDEDAPGLPWRYGVSRLTTEGNLASLVQHLEGQRSLGMADGQRYYLRFADTRALATLERVLTPAQVLQLKGPVTTWRYTDRFGQASEFGAGVPAQAGRQDMLVLADEQAAQLLELQLAGTLADDIEAASGGELAPHLDAEDYRHVEACAAFVLEHGIDPFEVQRHLATVAVKTGGKLLSEPRFLEEVQTLRPSGRWQELMRWRAV